jgi:WD40 repeat protein
VPRDLETIVLKAITRDPAHRYQTPTELADDLRRFVEDRPIRARRVGAGERLWRWCRRNPALAGLMALVQIALVGLLVLGAWSHVRIRQALTDKDGALQEKEDARAEAVRSADEAVAVSYRALLNETQALRLAHASGWRHQALEKLRKLAHLETPQRDLAELRSEAVACLGEFDVNLETRFLGHMQSVWSLDFSPDSTLLASAGYDGRLFLWDVKGHRPVREVADPALNLGQRHAPTAPLPTVRFRPGGRSLAYATWEPGFGVLGVGGEDPGPATRIPFPAAAHDLGFDGRGRLLAVGWGDGRVGLYEAGAATPRRVIQTGVGDNVHFPVALAPDGTRLAAIGPDHTVQLYAAADDSRDPIVLGRHRGIVRSLCFSPSGRLLASAAEDQTVKLWKIGGGEEPITLLGHSARVSCVAFSPDESLVASASDDETVRLWETQTGQALRVLQPRIGAVLSVAISPDGRRLAAGGVAQVCLYQLTSRQEQRRLVGHTFFVNALAFHPSRPLLASGSGDRTILFWDLQTNRPTQRWEEKRHHPVDHLAFSPDGTLLAVGPGAYILSGDTNFAIELRETATGTTRRRLPGPTAGVKGLAYDPSGTLLAAATINGDAFLWDTRTGETRRAWKGSGTQAVAFVGNGTHLVTGEAGGQVVLRAVVDGGAIRETVVPGGLSCLAPAPGERALAVGGNDGALRILALPGLELSATLDKAHPDKIKVAAFSPNGRLLASAGGADLQVILWDARTCQRLCTLPQTSQVNRLAFDPAGRRLATCGAELVTVWDLALVNEELAAVGLDWDASLPKTGLPPGALVDARPAQVTVVEAPRRPVPPPRPPEPSKSSTVVVPLNPRHRRATAEEMAGWIRQLAVGDAKVRQAAADALTEVGPPAVPALAAAAEQPERRFLARTILDRIAAAEILAPTRVRLKLEDALPADAIRALSERSRIPMRYEPPPEGQAPRRISLDLEDVPVWEALDRICEAAGLGHSCPDRAVVQVGHQPPRPPAVRSYAGPFRLHLGRADHFRSLILAGSTPQTLEGLHLFLGLLLEPTEGVLSFQSLARVTEARGADGQALPLSPSPIGYPQLVDGIFTGGLQIPLKAPERRVDRIKVLRAVLPVELMVRRQDLVMVPDLARAAGQTFAGGQGHRLTMGMVGPPGVYQLLEFRLSGLGVGSQDLRLFGVEVLDARRRRQLATRVALTPAPTSKPQPEDLAWLAAPPAPSLAGLPWVALALQGSPGNPREWRGTVQVPPSFEAPIRLRFFRFERLRTDLPFELHDVPLP